MGHALVLNASYEPLHIVSWQRAIQLLFQGKVEVVEEGDREIRTVRITIRMPTVLRLLKYVPIGRKSQVIRFSRGNVFARDEYVCQYCGTKHARSHLTLDHVIPVVQGGSKSWDNIVTACKPCNQRKGGRTPAEARMHLVRKPFRPLWLPGAGVSMGIAVTPDSWRIYLRLGSGSRGNTARGDDQ